MFNPIRKTHPILKIINGAIIDLPAPLNISILWNFGSLLGLCLVIQVLTGIFLAMHYTPNISMAFASVAHITQDVNYGWLLRSMHANCGSFFFLCLYMHVGRGIYYSSYLFTETWNLGVILMIATMATAFVGYVLPWGQMSFWGASVITNLLSAFPYIGKSLVEWVWGGFAVDNATLNRFFVFHFILPFVLMAISMLHLLSLHQTGSNNPLGLNSDTDKIPFHPYFTTKDMLGFLVMLLFLTLIVMFSPNLLTDPDNFIPANPLVTPMHIKPEWYFLWAYAILRSIPNKLGGVVALFSSLLILFILPLTYSQKRRGTAFYPLNQILFWILATICVLLTWIGGCPVEAPYELIGQVLTVMYFMYYIISPMMYIVWDFIIDL